MALLLVVIGAIIALIVLGLVLLPSFIDEAQIIALAQEQVRKTTGGELTVEGDIELVFTALLLSLCWAIPRSICHPRAMTAVECWPLSAPST